MEEILHQLMWFMPVFIGFQPSKVMQDFFHPQHGDLMTCNGMFMDYSIN